MYDDELKIGYNWYQDFLYAIQTRDNTRFNALLNEIKNSLELPYSNRLLECLNNHIKVLKRNAFGFSNFYNFKLRISLCFGTILFQENKSLEEISSRNHTNRFNSLNFLHQH